MNRAITKTKRKRAGICPVCLSRLPKNTRGTRYVRQCANCGATEHANLKCSSCSNRRVWQGPRGVACKGCGQVAGPEGSEWVVKDDLITPHDLWRGVCESFPTLSEEIADDANLPHLTMASLERLAITAIRDADWATLDSVYTFVLRLVHRRDELHPNVLNAIYVSFLEGLNFAELTNGSLAKARLPALLGSMWNEVMDSL